MAKKDLLADAIARLASLRKLQDPAQLAAGLVEAFNERSGYVLERVADLAAERGARSAIPLIIARLEKVLRDLKSDDQGGKASLALVRALTTLEAGRDAEDVATLATKYVRWESVYGGSVDVGVATRGNAAILLAAMGSHRATRSATELLAEPDQAGIREIVNWPARADAARALTMIGSEAAAAVLRFKLLIGDAETNVLADALAGLLAIEREAAIPLAVEMLNADDERRAEAALLALGGWRDPRPIELLKSHAEQFLHSASRDLFLASVAMTRQPAAIDYLIELAGTSTANLRVAVVEALQPLRTSPGVADRLAAALARS